MLSVALKLKCRDIAHTIFRQNDCCAAAIQFAFRLERYHEGDDDSNHTRCAQCGSLLYSVVRDGAYVHVALGSLTDAPTLRPTEHIFVGSKAPWFELTDDLPRYEELG